MSIAAAPADGIRAMVPRERMCESARKLRDTYTITPGAPLCSYETVTCKACTRIHFVNRLTGKLPGE